MRQLFTHRNIAIIILLFAIGIAWLFGVGTPGSQNFPRPFSSTSWKTADTIGKTRCAMVTDLRYRVGLIGKTRDQIEDLLGPPDSIDAGTSRYYLCPSFLDLYALELTWQEQIVTAADVGDT